jgi:1-acyl-sn-glycerol-3-phosphate acyltransferase
LGANDQPRELRERPVQLRRGSALAAVVLRVAGWSIRFDGLPAAQGVVVVYPHTSNWDFVVGMLAKWAVGIEVTFWGKASLFAVPLLGRWLRWLGGLPVARNRPQGAVGQMIEDMRTAREEGRFMWLALSPEGTRAPGEGWRSGFYRVALEAQVPVALVYLDYARKRLGVDSCWRLSGRPEVDYELIAQRFAGVRGLRPEAAAPVRPL